MIEKYPENGHTMTRIPLFRQTLTNPVEHQSSFEFSFWFLQRVISTFGDFNDADDSLSESWCSECVAWKNLKGQTTYIN